MYAHAHAYISNKGSLAAYVNLKQAKIFIYIDFTSVLMHVDRNCRENCHTPLIGHYTCTQSQSMLSYEYVKLKGFDCIIIKFYNKMLN
jgi:hypothetical protein